jgi:glycosyltransferase involved in cell wall biosynthesis
VLLTVARLDYLKDHGTAVRCLQCVVREIPAAKLVLVGTGPELQKIQAQVREADLEAHVRLLGLRQDIERLLPAADLFLLTSISEGIPLTVIEAMAAGLPVVATRVGGMAEVVEDGVTGCLAASGDDAALAAQVVHLARSPHVCATMGGRGQERARVMFSEEQMHARYFDLYREMLRA